ncbi:hypothetical protein ACE5D9_02335 [Rickettsia sp. 2024-CO-Wats]|uniref:hypothetical protein n=1 Tax=unclassified Rickettsia TaxID=114295 RepID=UPI00370DB841
MGPEAKNHQLFYDTSSQRLLDANGKVVSTIGKESKSMNNVQAFVMGEDGTIYIGTHKINICQILKILFMVHF